MNICTTCHRPSLNIRFDQSFYYERLPYIESVCSALIESRFGAAGRYQHLKPSKTASAFSVMEKLSCGFLAQAGRIAREMSRLIRTRYMWPTLAVLLSKLHYGLPQTASLKFRSVLTANSLGRGSPFESTEQLLAES
ncbi:MAG TPA: hypothetical protein VHQ01_06780 [Pyrinomonadaceae bacterium]|nr:hypothetical protein [Pyrinomonadaceae bacterium]